MKFVAKEKSFSGKLFGEGLHFGVIQSIDEDEPSFSDTPWVDKTPQIKAVVRNDEGFITVWFNLAGYKNASDFPDGVAPKGHEFVSSDKGNEEYLMNSKTKVRVQDNARTEKAVANLLDFAAKAGIDGEFEPADLVDKPIGVQVRKLASGKVEAHYFVRYEEEEVTA